MAANGEIYLQRAGYSPVLLSPFGRTYTRKTIEISREGRTASGRMVKDIITVKYRFEFSYDTIDGNDLQTILGLYSLKETFTLYIHSSASEYFLNYDGVAPVVFMTIGDVERLLLLGNGLWSGFTLTLEEE